MPKSKKKKTKNQDFQKVKLKVGKKLPKGDNVTNLSFKTRQIQLAQRIKDDGGKDIITKKKLNIQDLLRQCDHHSSSARVNAISGLKEIWLSSSADLMVPANGLGYGEILMKLSPLFIDNEAIVRHSVINLFKLILTKLSPKNYPEGSSLHKIGGRLYTHIHAYLCCAMNHVHEDIKLDSLVLFDTLLDCFPHFMVQQTGDLLNNLVGFISSPAYLGAKGDSTTQRLSMNPDSKLSAMKFRAQVLIRMKRTFMEALDDQTRDRNARAAEYAKNYKERVVWSLYRDHNGPNTKQDTLLYTGPSRFSVIFQGDCLELDEYITKPSTLESFLNLSVPVLLQCWKEAHASVSDFDSDNLVSADSVEVMSLVACVIQLMFVLCASHPKKDPIDPALNLYLVSPDVLVENFQQDFEKVLFRDFPYSVQVQRPLTKKRKKNKTFQTIDNGAGQTSLYALNLAICDVMSIFCASQTFKPRFNYVTEMEDYLVRSLQKFPSMERSKILVRILQNVFYNGQVNGANFIKVYTAVLKHYLSCPLKVPQKLLFYNLFAFMTRAWRGWKRINTTYQSISLNKNLTDFSGILEDFIQTIPKLLVDVVTLGGEIKWMTDLLIFMAHGHVLNCSRTFHDSFKATLSFILDPQIGVAACDDENAQKRLFSLLALAKPLNEDHLKLVLYLIRRPINKPVLHRRRSCSIVSYSIYCIGSCIGNNIPLTDQVAFNNMTPDQHSQLSDYLRFLFSLQIGMTGEELEAISPNETRQEDSDRWFDVDFTVQGDQWERHVEIACLVARVLVDFRIPANPSKGYHQSFTYIGNFEQFWKQTFMNRSKVHIMSAYSLIQFLYLVSFPHIEEKPGPELYKLASYIVASVLTSINCQSDPNSILRKQMMWQIKSDVIQCMTNDASLLTLVMELLAKRSKDAPSEMEREAARAAEYLMLLDEKIKLMLIEQRRDGSCSRSEVASFLVKAPSSDTHTANMQ